MLRSLCIVVAFLALLSQDLHAQTQRFGEWFIDTLSRDGLYAATVNESGNLLGQFCYPGEGACVYLIGMKTGCERGARYPVLANSDAGSLQLEVLCDGQLESGLFRYAFTDFDRLDELVKKGNRIGIAVPLQSDKFRVVRFDLRGASASISVMRAAAESQTRPTRRGTRDQTL